MRRLALPPLPLCLMVLPLIFPGVGYAQDASKIIDQYAKAAGGTKNLGKVQTSPDRRINPGYGRRNARDVQFPREIAEPVLHRSEKWWQRR